MNSHEQRSDEISTEELIYMAGLHDGKKQERPWVGLTKEEIDSALVKYASWYNFATHLENILKEKNYG